MNKDIEKLNKQIILSDKSSDEAKKAAILDMWNNKVKSHVYDDVSRNIESMEDGWHKIKAMEHCVLAVIGNCVDPGYDCHDDLRTETELHQEELKYSQEIIDRSD